MDTATDLAGDAIAKAKGRKSSDGTEDVIKTKPLKEAVAELETLKTKADAAKDKLNDAIKAVAERSGLLSKVVRKLVNARHGEDFEDAKREVMQLGIVFDEVGDK